tara:strand:- start:282 stop:467 length:186 start_codon:yes stop_codon:yes gene_type:complete
MFIDKVSGKVYTNKIETDKKMTEDNIHHPEESYALKAELTKDYDEITFARQIIITSWSIFE